MHFITYTTAVQPISIQPLQTQQKPRVTEAQHNAEKALLVCYIVTCRHSYKVKVCRKSGCFFGMQPLVGPKMNEFSKNKEYQPVMLFNANIKF